MFRLYKKRVITAILTMMVLVFNSSLALATDGKFDNTNAIRSNSEVSATITITDPETGQIWKWEAPVSDIQVYSETTSTYDTASDLTPLDGEIINTTAVTVDVGQYLAATYSQSRELTDNITIKTGLTYSYYLNSGAKVVSIKSIFGSTTPIGLYYATDRVAWWRHSGTGGSGTYYPTSNSWSYTTDSTDGVYSSGVPPYSAAECKVRVSGMPNSYRIITVTCNLLL